MVAGQVHVSKGTLELSEQPGGLEFFPGKDSLSVAQGAVLRVGQLMGFNGDYDLVGSGLFEVLGDGTHELLLDAGNLSIDMEALGSFVMEERLVIDEDAMSTNKGAAKWGGALEGRGRFINDAGRTPLVMVGGRVFKLEQSAVFENRGVIEHERGARLSIDESSQLENKGTYNLRGRSAQAVKA